VVDGCIASLSVISGSNRYATSVAVSKFAFPDGADDIFLLGGEALVDGMAASSLQGPKLLVPPNSTTLPKVVVEEIKRLRPARVHKVSGHVSDAQLHKAEVAAGLTSAL